MQTTESLIEQWENEKNLLEEELLSMKKKAFFSQDYYNLNPKDKESIVCKFYANCTFLSFVKKRIKLLKLQKEEEENTKKIELLAEFLI